MSKTILLSSLLAFSLLFSACSSEKKEQEDANALLAKNEIVLTATDMKQYVLKKDNEGYTLENSKAKILILDIFATWCPPCQAEATHLSSLQKKYKDQIKIIGVTVEENVPNTKLETFRKKFNAQYPLVNSSENSRLIDEIAQKLQLGRNFGIPLLVIYKDGKLVKYYQGAVEEEFIESDIKRALEI
ncbi:TlpA family protein disulfide reductase [Sulfurimonas paralvinellae]|uniref:TlpA family protein disulfide reductase n=1 Tax=Sulfurimonas paralvinellae TaxID=317658 RepID=A0A7M1B8I0_9BACT|nr:TlpA disulfide reductase family protein [Sulfurimonas paralvinellae]QOP46014.1 TlpA family protein disulfide reductase [Sulfurimonas paralvinellae]